MTLGERIRGRREEIKWTQVRLAKEVGVSPSFITRLEKGEVLPGADIAFALARALVLDNAELDRLTDQDRQDRLRRRREARDAMLRSAYGASNVATTPDVTRTRDGGTAEQLGREILGNPDFQAAFGYLRDILSEPELREVALHSLRGFAELANSRRVARRAKPRAQQEALER